MGSDSLVNKKGAYRSYERYTSICYYIRPSVSIIINDTDDVYNTKRKQSGMTEHRTRHAFHRT